jgi:hypothetical protein
MALRFFAAHCASNQIIAALQQAGHEIIRLNLVMSLFGVHVSDYPTFLLCLIQ